MKGKSFESGMETNDWNMAVAFLKRIDENCRAIDDSISEGYVAGALRRIMALLAAVKPIFEDRLKGFDYKNRYDGAINRVKNTLTPMSTGVRMVDSAVRKMSYEQSDTLLIALYHTLMYDLYKSKLVFGEDEHKTWQQEFKEDF